MAGSRRLKRFLQRGDLTFGLREAIILSLVAVSITIAVAYHYTASARF